MHSGQVPTVEVTIDWKLRLQDRGLVSGLFLDIWSLFYASLYSLYLFVIKGLLSLSSSKMVSSLFYVSFLLDKGRRDGSSIVVGITHLMKDQILLLK